MAQYTFEPIGYIDSCFTEKFGIPRQPGLVPEATAVLEIAPPFSHENAFRHLERFSHVWIIFVFHQTLGKGWKTTVRPPRLGGNERVGVFASRSGFRPNAIGQSAVELISIRKKKPDGGIELTLGGVDFLHGTPVLDIKPYLPYADAISDAKSGYAHDAPQQRWPVKFSPDAALSCNHFEANRYPGLAKIITDLLALDPRPGYRNKSTRSENTAPCRHGIRLWNLNITFYFHADHIEVASIQEVV